VTLRRSGAVLGDVVEHLGEARDAGGRERADRTGADRVDADAARTEVGGEVAHARLERRLGDAHDVVVRIDALAADVGQRHDRALAAFHQRQRACA
jgi:hypothetical protein